MTGGSEKQGGEKQGGEKQGGEKQGGEKPGGEKQGGEKGEKQGGEKGEKQGSEVRCDVLAVGAHPDDVEIGCGGTLALLSARGLRVGICHLTGGEAGTRGDRATRRREAKTAAGRLGAHALFILDCGDGGLRTGRAEEDALIDVIRMTRPRLVFAHGGPDRHPDHERAAALTRSALFYARLQKRHPAHPPHRVEHVLTFALHGMRPPDVVVDVSETFDTKLTALAGYASQFGVPRAHHGEGLQKYAASGASDPAATKTWVPVSEPAPAASQPAAATEIWVPDNEPAPAATKTWVAVSEPTAATKTWVPVSEPAPAASQPAAATEIWVPDNEPAPAATKTWVSSDAFWAALRGRAQAVGALAEVALGEGFASAGPLLLDAASLCSLLAASKAQAEPERP